MGFEDFKKQIGEIIPEKDKFDHDEEETNKQPLEEIQIPEYEPEEPKEDDKKKVTYKF